MGIHQRVKQGYFLSHIPPYYRRVMPYPCFVRHKHVCLQPAVPPVINPDWVFCIVNYYFLQVNIFEEQVYVSQSNILLKNIIYQHVNCFFVGIWKIFCKELQNFALELLLNIADICIFIQRFCFLRYKLIPYFLKNYFCRVAYVGD